MTSENAPSQYQIRIKGQFSTDWSDWFDGFSISHDETGNTTLSGIVVDQAQLYGLLKRIRDVGAELISVNIINEADDV